MNYCKSGCLKNEYDKGFNAGQELATKQFQSMLDKSLKDELSNYIKVDDSTDIHKVLGNKEQLQLMIIREAKKTIKRIEEELWFSKSMDM